MGRRRFNRKQISLLKRYVPGAATVKRCLDHGIGEHACSCCQQRYIFLGRCEVTRVMAPMTKAPESEHRAISRQAGSQRSCVRLRTGSASSRQGLVSRRLN